MNKPVTVLHLADIHFGVDNYGVINTRTGLPTRLEDFSTSLQQAWTMPESAGGPGGIWGCVQA